MTQPRAHPLSASEGPDPLRASGGGWGGDPRRAPLLSAPEGPRPPVRGGPCRSPLGPRAPPGSRAPSPGGPCPEPPALTRRSPAIGHTHQPSPDSRPALLLLASSAGRRDPQLRLANRRRERAVERGWLSGQGGRGRREEGPHLKGPRASAQPERDRSPKRSQERGDKCTSVRPCLWRHCCDMHYTDYASSYNKTTVIILQIYWSHTHTEPIHSKLGLTLGRVTHR